MNRSLAENMSVEVSRPIRDSDSLSDAEMTTEVAHLNATPVSTPKVGQIRNFCLMFKIAVLLIFLFFFSQVSELEESPHLCNDPMDSLSGVQNDVPDMMMTVQDSSSTLTVPHSNSSLPLGIDNPNLQPTSTVLINTSTGEVVCAPLFLLRCCMTVSQ